MEMASTLVLGASGPDPSKTETIVKKCLPDKFS